MADDPRPSPRAASGEAPRPDYGPVGVIMLNTHFPRLPGDVGHPDTFEGHVLYHRVTDARVAAVVKPGLMSEPLANALLDAARDLERRGAAIITTSCGFLSTMQERLRAAVSVPVVSSALVLLPLLRAGCGPHARIGVLTFDTRALTASHFGGAWGPDVVLEGLELSREFHAVIAEDRPALDAATAEGEIALAAQRLRARAGGTLDAVVLECTNLAPFLPRIRAEAGAPVFDLAAAVRWMARDLL
ncbi:aspartate/glutamate racemase family protein [Roseospira navarrensis]|uniref:Aspartate/glutamate racemase family protein n=1 Tax=Roseospira navarrensis TaxID=140058 RepID=A0A7X2D231_9PROT|nr:aspartate/glutamate racemase family protein [Roseospira navarrensis]MQX35333.1 aspartate/glutamate racemase family protein [Roseospira navarrensis]